MGGAQILKNSAVFTDIESDFSAEIGNSNDFSAQSQVISKKKKVFTEIKSDFSAEIGNSDDFSAQNQVISKKKKVFTEIKSDFSAEIGNSDDFSAQNQVISKKKKKKRSSPKLREVFRPKPLAWLLLYCSITVMCTITKKKLQLNIVRLCCHNFLSLVEFWLGAPPGYAYGRQHIKNAFEGLGGCTKLYIILYKQCTANDCCIPIFVLINSAMSNAQQEYYVKPAQ